MCASSSEQPSHRGEDLHEDDHNVDEHKADQHNERIHTDLGRDLCRLCLEPLKLQLFHVVGEHLKIDAAVIAAQDIGKIINITPEEVKDIEEAFHLT